MKIVQIVPELKLAGAQIMVESLSKELKKRGHDVVIISLYSIDTPITKRLTQSGIKVIFLEKKNGFDFKVIIKLHKLIKSIRPDIIHTHSYTLKYAYFATLSMHFKMIHTIHNIADKETTPANLKFAKKLYRKKIVCPVAISPTIKKSIADYYGLDESTVPMIFNGIALNKCIVKDDYALHTPPQIIHIGRFQEQKNHSMIIDAMEKVCKVCPDVNLVLWGEGELKDELVQKVRNLHLEKNVIFAGLTDDPYKELNQSDIFILPSKWEGMPITLIDAMASALPCIVTSVGGIPDMVEDNVSGVISLTDSDDLSAKICKLLEDELMRKKIGIKALEKSTMFSDVIMCDRYLDVYEHWS